MSEEDAWRQRGEDRGETSTAFKLNVGPEIKLDHPDGFRVTVEVTDQPEEYNADGTHILASREPVLFGGGQWRVASMSVAMMMTVMIVLRFRARCRRDSTQIP